jgi:hypothetical protein
MGRFPMLIIFSALHISKGDHVLAVRHTASIRDYGCPLSTLSSSQQPQGYVLVGTGMLGSLQVRLGGLMCHSL